MNAARVQQQCNNSGKQVSAGFEPGPSAVVERGSVAAPHHLCNVTKIEGRNKSVTR
jgi:hypothetical protein